MWGLLIVALFWGTTNPFLKHYSAGISRRQGQGLLGEARFLWSSRGYLCSLLLNWVGSVLFYLLLRDGDLSVVVPVCNSLTFALTLLVGAVFFGEPISRGTILGLGFIVAGTLLMTMPNI